MENRLTPTIGIEIHLELSTKTKMFSPAKNQFNAPPNTNIHPIDLGYLGTLPRPNKEAVISAIKLAKALNMEIATSLSFDRKHYFYPDLPKSFQITQFFQPIGKNGTLLIKTKSGQEKEVRIARIHLEEDTAKQIHTPNATLLDYNRCGVPLIEIVTYPVFSNGEEVKNYVELIRQLVRCLNISKARMEEGSLRVDLNISISKTSSNLGTRVEIKNLNSLNNIQKAVEYEIKTQFDLIKSGAKVKQVSKRFDEIEQKTVFMRKKESETDYYYFPEPNIPLFKLSPNFIDSITLPELPWDREKRFKKLNLQPPQTNALINNFSLANYFDMIDYPDRKRVANIFFSEIVSIVNSKKISFQELKITPKNVADAIRLVDSGDISSKQLKQAFKLIEEGAEEVDFLDFCQKNNLKQIVNISEIEKIVEQTLFDNADFIYANRANKKKLFGYLVGKIMAQSGGQINPQLVAEYVNKKLDKKLAKD